MKPWRLSRTASLFMLLASSCADTVETSSSSPPPDASPATCSDAAAVTGIEVAYTDIYGGPPYALGYPPYSIDGCSLAYVAGSGADAGALLVRGLGSTKDLAVAAPADEVPRRPSLGENILAWEA